MIKFVALCHIENDLQKNYDLAVQRIEELHKRLSGTKKIVTLNL
jgi:hypothetical protein